MNSAEIVLDAYGAREGMIRFVGYVRVHVGIPIEAERQTRGQHATRWNAVAPEGPGEVASPSWSQVCETIGQVVRSGVPRQQIDRVVRGCWRRFPQQEPRDPPAVNVIISVRECVGDAVGDRRELPSRRHRPMLEPSVVARRPGMSLERIASRAVRRLRPVGWSRPSRDIPSRRGQPAGANGRWLRAPAFANSPGASRHTTRSIQFRREVRQAVRRSERANPLRSNAGVGPTTRHEPSRSPRSPTLWIKSASSAARRTGSCGSDGKTGPKK